jgi:hypothetical protein
VAGKRKPTEPPKSGGPADPLAAASGALAEAREARKREMLARLGALVNDLSAAGLRLFTRQLWVDGRPGDVEVGITEAG